MKKNLKKVGYKYQVDVWSYEMKENELKFFKDFVQDVITLRKQGNSFQKIADHFREGLKNNPYKIRGSKHRQTYHKIWKANKDNPFFK